MLKARTENQAVRMTSVNQSVLQQTQEDLQGPAKRDHHQAY